MDVSVYIFDSQFHITQIITDGIQELTHAEHSFMLSARLPAATKIQIGFCIGLMCVDNRFRLFEVDSYDVSDNDGSIFVSATDSAVRDLLDNVVTDIRPTNLQSGAAVAQLIRDTDWQLGAVTATGTGSMRAYYQSLWSALVEAESVFDAHIIPYYVFEHGHISAKRIDVISTEPVNRGRLYETGDDASNVIVSIAGQIKTALYGRGRGVEIEGDTDIGSSFGRRLTFGDIAWSKASGDPADKPAGQEWVGDEDARALYGRHGRHRFGVEIFDQETDAGVLLQKTWDLLQKLKYAKLTATATIRDMEMLPGYSHKAIRLHDAVTVRPKEYPNDILAQIIGIERDYITPENTRLTIGNATESAGAMIGRMSRQLSDFDSKSDIWNRAKAFDINGVMDVMNNQITSTVGHWYTDPATGSIMFVSADNTLAMRMNGAGWQIANGNVGGQWQWRTAATGSGIVADTITAGVINAALVTILGNEHFYMAGANLIIEHPTNPNRQIRVGNYTGNTYGIGFTIDGGATWQTAISFDGAVLSAADAQTLSQLALDVNGIALSVSDIEQNGLSLAYIKLTSSTLEALAGAMVSFATNNFIIKNADGKMMLSISAENSATGEPGGQIVLGEAGFPVRFAPGFVLPPLNGGTGYESGQTHRMVTPPPGTLGIDGDLAVVHSGSGGAYPDRTPSLQGAGTSILFGRNRTWNQQTFPGWVAIGNHSPDNGGLYGSYWSFTSPTGVQVTAISFKFRAAKIINGQWSGWNTGAPLYAGLYGGDRNTLLSDLVAFQPPNSAGDVVITLTAQSALPSGTLYIALFDTADTLNKSRAFVQMDSVLIPGSTGGQTETIYIKSNGQWKDKFGEMPKIRSGNVLASSAGAAISFDGFVAVPYIVATYAQEGAAWSGDSGAIKIYNKSTTGATIQIGGSFASRAVDWIAIGS